MNSALAPRAFGNVGRADPSDDTIINGTPYHSNVIDAPAKDGGSAHWREYPRDHGPDLDDWLDETECPSEV